MRTAVPLGLAVAVVLVAAVRAATPPTPTALVARGEQVFRTNCVACHGAGIGNPGMAMKPGTDALRVKYGGQEPPVLSDRRDLQAEFIGYTVRNGATLMPFFRKTEVSDADLRALSAYLTRDNPPPK